MTEYEVAVPSTAVRVRFNCMSYQAGGIKYDGMLGNMRVYPLEGATLMVKLTLHDHDDNLTQTYTFTITKSSTKGTLPYTYRCLLAGESEEEGFGWER